MGFDLDDLIAALASPPGPAARAIIRISGDESRRAATRVFQPDNPAAWESTSLATRHAGTLQLDELDVRLPAAAYVWPTRRSYTGQPLVELHLPGSPPLAEATLAQLYRNGVRPARPGEFTLRAFLAGRLDLVQAEAVLGVIDAPDHRELDVALRQLAGGVSGRLADVRSDLLSLLADLEAGLDFVDEDIEFVTRDDVINRVEAAHRAIEELLSDIADRWRDAGRQRVVLAGLPNAGKSTLFNALVGAERAIVSPVAGTTRDWLSAEMELSGVAIELIDTAGWESAANDLESAMQTLRAEQLDRADLIVWCTAIDCSAPDLETDASLRESLHERLIVVRTKNDLSATDRRQTASPFASENGDRRVERPGGLGSPLALSAVSGEGLDALREAIAAELAIERSGTRQLIGSTAARGRESLSAARDALDRARNAAETGFGDEIVAAELRLALGALASVLGVVYTDDVLDVIFSRFCIGK